MIASEHTQSLSEFRKKAAETIARLNKTGEAEIITVNGEAKAVLISPQVYDEMARETELARDVAMIQRSMQEIREGKTKPLNVVFDELRARLLRVQDGHAKGATN